MTLLACYQARCDAPGCSASVFLADNRTSACRSRLIQLGWLILPTRTRSESPGAPRILYLCPGHRGVRPEGWREARSSAIRRLARGRMDEEHVARDRPVNLDGVEAPTEHLDTARRCSLVWALVEMTGSQVVVARALGVTHQRVHQIVRAYKEILERRRQSAAGWSEPWAKRLRAAGAIP